MRYRINARYTNFYPRSPCGERHGNHHNYNRNPHISIHALLAESDCQRSAMRSSVHPFLSTLSLRRATQQKCRDGKTHVNFYPRSPCGERLAYRVQLGSMVSISIHALLAESDGFHKINCQMMIISIHALLAESDTAFQKLMAALLQFLSTLSLRRATNSPALLSNNQNISIHALLAESDRRPGQTAKANKDFYPRSPCGERPLAPEENPTQKRISIHALLAESDPWGCSHVILII